MVEKANPEQFYDPFHSAQVVGESLIALGVLGLLAAIVQHWQILKRIDDEQFIYRPPRALPMIVAMLLLLIGVFAFVSILL
jgi:uncharacterized membrane protein YidH (DUF202 family)